jgi:hypothetical protein
VQTIPELECDLVMKGGITSGIVYPKAICAIAETYRLRSIGGSSAGAIAAAAAGAAELGRQTGADAANAGFAGLAELPRELSETLPSGMSRLRSFFQPTPALKPAFDVLFHVIGRSNKLRTALAAAAAMVAGAPLSTALVLSVVALVGWSMSPMFTSGTVRWPVQLAAAVSLFALLLLLLLFPVVVLVRRSLARVGRNGFGFCNGLADEPVTGDPPLTNWLTAYFNQLAGRAADAPPVTLGDLHAVDVEVVVTTTNLFERRPYRIPFVDRSFFFREEELRRFFPRAVVDTMVEGAKQLVDAAAEKSDTRRFAAQGFLPFPDDDHLPLVVGVRMSLSFPILLSAVPLYDVDWRRGDDAMPERVWFSDGGICSNLPIHFFDSLLPSRPTFAIDLQPAGEEGVHADERRNVTVPSTNLQGLFMPWHRFDDDGWTAPLQMVGAVINTMQTWNDEMQARVPGYRDRIARVLLDEAREGGLNLDMPDTIINALGERGGHAGDGLVERFGPRGDFEGWKNHVWIRYRTLLEQIEHAAERIHTRRFEDEEALAVLEGLIDDRPSYKNGWTHAHKQRARELHAHFIQLVAWRREHGVELGRNAPKPTPQLRVRPRF